MNQTNHVEDIVTIFTRALNELPAMAKVIDSSEELGKIARLSIMKDASNKNHFRGSNVNAIDSICGTLKTIYHYNRTLFSLVACLDIVSKAKLFTDVNTHIHTQRGRTYIDGVIFALRRLTAYKSKYTLTHTMLPASIIPQSFIDACLEYMARVDCGEDATFTVTRDMWDDICNSGHRDLLLSGWAPNDLDISTRIGDVTTTHGVRTKRAVFIQRKLQGVSVIVNAMGQYESLIETHNQELFEIVEKMHELFQSQLSHTFLGNYGLTCNSMIGQRRYVFYPEYLKLSDVLTDVSTETFRHYVNTVIKNHGIEIMYSAVKNSENAGCVLINVLRETCNWSNELFSESEYNSVIDYK